MSDWPRVVKYLDRLATRKATEEEGANAPYRFDKYYNLYKGRAIQKLYTYLILPGKLYAYADIPTRSKFPRLLFQYNLTLPQAFYVLDASDAQWKLKSGVLCIKYRIGTTVYRYKLARSYNLPDPTDVFWVHQYAQQQIKPEVVLEFWYTGTSAMFHYAAGINGDIKIKLSRLYNPDYAEELERDYVADAAIEIPALGFPLDADLPQSQPTIVYNSN